MPDSKRHETQIGLAELTKRLASQGLSVHARESTSPRRTYCLVSIDDRATDFEVYDTFLDQLPSNHNYREAIDSYAAAVAGRAKYGSPESFYCLSGAAVRIEVQWPILIGTDANTWMLIHVTNLVDKLTANCSVCMTRTIPNRPKTIFDDLQNNSCRIRTLLDEGKIKFHKLGEHPPEYQPIKINIEKVATRDQSEAQQFLERKIYTLGFLVPENPCKVWAVDPWDAEYLGLTKKDLTLAARVLKANGLIDLDESSSYAQTNDKLLVKQTSVKARPPSAFAEQEDLTLRNIPNAEDLTSELVYTLQRTEVVAVLLIDLDHFKAVNDSKGHLEGTRCLESVIKVIADALRHKGKLFRYGGDEFVAVLPGFNTEEARATAERIRFEVEQAKLGGDTAITSSIGLCASDRLSIKFSRRDSVMRGQCYVCFEASGQEQGEFVAVIEGNSVLDVRGNTGTEHGGTRGQTGRFLIFFSGTRGQTGRFLIFFSTVLSPKPR